MINNLIAKAKKSTNHQWFNLSTVLFLLLGLFFMVYSWIVSGIDDASNWWKNLCFFTTQSNWLVLFTVGCTFIKNKNNKIVKIVNTNNFRNMIAGFITVTFLIYWSILFPADTNRGMSAEDWVMDIWKHGITPIFMCFFAIYYLINYPDGTQIKNYPKQFAISILFRMIYPLFYLIVFVVIIQAITDWPVYGDKVKIFNTPNPAEGWIYIIISMIVFVFINCIWANLGNPIKNKKSK
ncbi:hypothetical protein ASO20_02625 [Mycoplasma sp. (ex Biomphalaria glabrata)]|uniref:hypothetical protein n=1 Tax=Mycoplasma sp. (ex Biomphalaria glabrata) TaxID=1749074 RepID=UPI00073ACA29|nr:hypothetical protein [Mycoplasma sp. (ex Biomphalaria glabrata)]ALV23530.1 hypothetical protein ASO20_02625 [Mycoplasma sp. (ex Biomphalaria glabrata)]